MGKVVDKIERVGMHGAKAKDLLRALNHRRSFDTSGAFRARRAVAPAAGRIGSGQLAGEDLERWKADRDQVIYVVLSYDTPIAWATSDLEPVYAVKQRFSMTTSHHQGKLYACDMAAGYFD